MARVYDGYVASLRTGRVKADGTPYTSVLYRLDGRQSSISFVGAAQAADAAYALELFNSVGPARAVELLKIVRTSRTGMTVETWLTRYIDQLTGVEQKTIDDYRRYVRRDIAPVLGALPLTELTEEHIGHWVQGLEKNGAAPKTISNKHGFLSGALAAAVPKHIPANPAAGRRLPRGEGEDEADEIRMLTHDEFKLLLAETTEYWRPMVEFMVRSGFRWGEVSALKPSDVDRAAGTVRVRRAWKLSSTGYTIGPPKTKRSRRKIDMPKSILDQLSYDHEWLFTNSGRGRRNAGGPVRYSNFRRNVWDPAVERAKLDPAPTPHDLRHTCASWMLNANVPITAVSRHLGHESIQVTVDVYGDVDRTTSRAVSDAMDGILGESAADGA